MSQRNTIKCKQGVFDVNIVVNEGVMSALKYPHFVPFIAPFIDSVHIKEG